MKTLETSLKELIQKHDCHVKDCEAMVAHLQSIIQDSKPVIQQVLADVECYCLPKSEGGISEPCARCRLAGLAKRYI